MTLLACLSAASSPLNGEAFILPLIELQSGPLTPGLTLDESPRPIHQVRLVVDAGLTSGKLILDGNRPEFDLFGDLISGLESPYVRVRGTGNSKLVVEIACSIELVEERPDKWRLYRIDGRDLSTSLRVATHGSIADGGQARLVILSADNKVTTVVECTRYGLAVP
jgi:hypothetical protein